MLDLALADQLLDGPRHVLHGHIRIDPVLIEEVDAVGLQPLECRLGDLADALRPAVHAGSGVPVLEAELGRDHDLIANRGQCLADEFLVREGTVGFGRVEERHAALERRPDQRDGAALVHGGP